VSKAVSKKADAKKTSAKLKLKAIADGSHGIDGGIYTLKRVIPLLYLKKHITTL